MIIVKILTMMMALYSCDGTQCMEDYYNTNKDNLMNIREYASLLNNNYVFDLMVIKKNEGRLEVIFEGEDSDNVSMLLNIEDLSLIIEFPMTGCSPEAQERYRTMYNDNNLRAILQIYNEIEPWAIKINASGVYISLGHALESNNSEFDGGIYMPFEPGSRSNWEVSEIDTNVYLVDFMVY